MKKSFISLFIVFVIGFFGYFLFLKKKDNRPNIVVILIDTLRADHTSLHGYFRDTTPSFKKIAHKGLFLQNFFVNSPWTKPSIGSFFTGLYPTAHGARKGLRDEISSFITVEILHPKLNTMAELLLDDGYNTHGLITNPHLTPLFNYDQGFENYIFLPDHSTENKVCASDQRFLNKTLKILKDRKNKPQFVWCHLMSVHEYACNKGGEKFHLAKNQKITPVPEYAPTYSKVIKYGSIEAAVCAYDNSIFYTDNIIGKFYENLQKNAPNTILIITSDHGEEFNEHGGFEHGRTLYNEILKVPCIITGPGIKKAKLSGLYDSVDIMPTLFNFIGLDYDFEEYTTRIFTKNQVLPGKKEIFAEQHHQGAYIRYALIKNGKKLIVNINKRYGNKKFEFYARSIQIEQENICSPKSPLIQSLYHSIQIIKGNMKKFFKKHVGKSIFKKMDKKNRERLKNLGYLQ